MKSHRLLYQLPHRYFSCSSSSSYSKTHRINPRTNSVLDRLHSQTCRKLNSFAFNIPNTPRLVSLTLINSRCFIILWDFRFHALFLCNNGGIYGIPSWRKALFLKKLTVLKSLRFVFIWVFVENGSWACCVAEDGLDCWDFAYFDCFGTVL